MVNNTKNAVLISQSKDFDKNFKLENSTLNKMVKTDCLNKV